MTFFLVFYLVYDLNQMMNLINHTTDNRSVLLFNHVVHFSKTQGI